MTFHGRFAAAAERPIAVFHIGVKQKLGFGMKEFLVDFTRPSERVCRWFKLEHYIR